MPSDTLSGPSPSSTGKCGTSAQYDIPMKDATCGVPNRDDNRDLMEKCCKSAPVTAYNKDCALYCPAVGQSIQNLTDCLYDEKVDWEDVWCHGDTTATATATDIPSATHKTNESSTKTQSSSSSTATDAETENKTGAASAVSSKGISSKVGLAICVMVVPAIFTGALY